MSDEKKAENKALAMSTLKLSVDTMAAVLAVTGNPLLAAGLKIGTASATYAKSFAQKKSERQLKRLEQHCQYLSLKLAAVEEDHPEERVDLFVEVLRKAVEDDEERKGPFYDCVMEWIIRGKPSPTQVRILSEGVQRLSYAELYGFMLWCSNTNGRQVVEAEQIPDSTFWGRVQSVGISTGSGGVITMGNQTALGKILVEYTDRERLVPPVPLTKNELGKPPKTWPKPKG